jgi:CBS domain-containing protein
MSVLEAGTRSLVVAYSDERVFDALTKMLENNIGRLPVVDRKDPQKLVGYINRATVMGSWRSHLREESVRDHGWWRNLNSIPENRGNGGVAIGRVKSLTEDTLFLTPDSDSSCPTEEFALNAPARGVFLGDEVRVSYRKENGHKVAMRVEELSSRQ